MRLDLKPTGPQFCLDLGERDAGLDLYRGSEQVLMRLNYRRAEASHPVRLG
jgi:hypothetical protein